MLNNIRHFVSSSIELLLVICYLTSEGSQTSLQCRQCSAAISVLGPALPTPTQTCHTKYHHHIWPHHTI